MTPKSKKLLYLSIGILISGYLIYNVFDKIEYDKLVTALEKANYFWLLPNIGLIVFAMYQRAFRWKFMLNPIKEVKFEKILASTSIGFMANNVLPARLGEFVRAYSLSAQDKEISKSASLATIFVERMVFDLVALLLIFGSILLFSENLQLILETDDVYGPLIIKGAQLAISVALIGIFSMLIIAHKPERVGQIMTKYLFFLPKKITGKVTSIVEKFADGLKFFKNIKTVFSVGLQTILLWLLMGASNYFVFLAFGFDIQFEASFVLLVVVSILIMAPSSPGFIGVYHKGVILSLGLYGILGEKAVACALVLHATQYVVITLMGFYYLKKEHLSLKELEETAEQSI